MRIIAFISGIFISLSSFSQISDTTFSGMNYKAPGLNITEIKLKRDLIDSPYIVIRLFKTSKYKISFLKDSLITDDIRLVGKFFEKHIGQFNKDEVFVIGDPNAKYENFKQVKDLLKKHEIYRFRIITEESP